MKCVQTIVGEVRSRGSFPVDYRHLSVDDCPIGDTNLPV